MCSLRAVRGVTIQDRGMSMCLLLHLKLRRFEEACKMGKASFVHGIMYAKWKKIPGCSLKCLMIHLRFLTILADALGLLSNCCLGESRWMMVRVVDGGVCSWDLDQCVLEDNLSCAEVPFLKKHTSSFSGSSPATALLYWYLLSKASLIVENILVHVYLLNVFSL